MRTVEFGGQSRAGDVERTADEIQAKFLITHAGEGASENWRMLYTTLLNPRLSDAAKVQYALLLPERKNFEWCNERTGKLTGKNARTVERLFNELAAEGCVNSTRRRNKTSTREFLAPKNSILVAATELLSRIEAVNRETTDLSFVNSEATKVSFVASEATETSFVPNRETTDLSSRNDRFVGQPLRYLPLKVIEEERYIPRASAEGCKQDILQSEEKSEVLVFTAENLKRWNTTTHRWGHSPTASLANFAVDPRITGADLKTDITALSKGRRVDLAQTALDIVLGNMFAMTLDEPTAKSVIGYKAAKSYLAKEFAGKLNELEKQEHERLAAAEVTQELAKITVGEAAAKAGIRVKGTETRTEGWNQVAKSDAANRIAGPAKPNGGQTPRANPNSRTVTLENGERRFNPDFKLIVAFGVPLVMGEHANALFDEIPGATFEDVDKALGKETGQSGTKAQSREEVLRSVKQTLRGMLGDRKDNALRAKFGGPINQLPEDHRCQSSFVSPWVVLSQEFISELEAKCPDCGVNYPGASYSVVDTIRDAFKRITDGPSFSYDDYGQGLQKRIEDELTAAMLAKQALRAADRERSEKAAAERAEQKRLEEESMREWMAGAEERSRQEKERAAKREAERLRLQAEEDAQLAEEARNLEWTAAGLALTEDGKKHFEGVDNGTLSIALSGLSRSWNGGLVKRTGTPSFSDLATFWKELLARAVFFERAAA